MLEYTSVYDGIVQDLDDPAGSGRARLLVPAVLGPAVSGWAKPLLGATNSSQASVGDSVWVMFEGGSVNRPVWVSPVTSGSGTVGPHEHDMDDVIGLDTTLAAKVPTTRNLTVGVGLVGGGTLNADRSFAVDFAASGSSSATKAVRADDSRLSNPREPTAHEHSYDDFNGAGQIELPLVMQRRSVGPASVPTGADAVYFKNDGRLYVMSDAEVERPLVPLIDYLHTNPSLDAVALSTTNVGSEPAVPARLMPTGWSWFWGTRGGGVLPTLVSDDVVTLSGVGRSVNITVPEGGSQALASSVWGVQAGAVITVSAWVRGTGPRAFLTILTSEPSSNPDFFAGPGSTSNDSSLIIPSGTWQKISHSFTVPTGHTKARFMLRSDAPTGMGGSIWWDESESTVTAAVRPPEAPSLHLNANLDSVYASTEGNQNTGNVASRNMPSNWSWGWSFPTTALSYPTLVADVSQTSDGIGAALKVSYTGTTTIHQYIWSSPFAVPVGTYVQVSAWIKGSADNMKGSLGILSANDPNPSVFVSGWQFNGASVGPSTGIWTKVTASAVMPAGHTHARVCAIVNNSGAAGDFWLDATTSALTLTSPLSAYSALAPALTANVWSANINHGLNLAALDVSFMEVASGESIDMDWKRVDADNIQLRPDVAFAAGAVRIFLTGRV